jgi:hypothetical protein
LPKNGDSVTVILKFWFLLMHKGRKTLYRFYMYYFHRFGFTADYTRY